MGCELSDAAKSTEQLFYFLVGGKSAEIMEIQVNYKSCYSHPCELRRNRILSPLHGWENMGVCYILFQLLPF